METGIAVAALGLLAALIASVWMRRSDWNGGGDTGSLLLGLVFSFVAVMLILIAVTGQLGS